MDLLRSKRGSCCPVDREGCGVPQNGRNGPLTIETGVMFIERGVAYSKTDETDLLRSKRGSCSSGGVWRTAKRTPQDTVHLPCRPPQASTCYHQPPPASTGSCSSSLHRALLHRLLFNTPPPSTVHPALHHLLFIQPSTPWGPVQPPLHRQLFIHPSTPRGPVHPEATPPLTVHQGKEASGFDQL